jgi:large subunit ribosomal protein L3
MTQVWGEGDRLIPVTVIEAGPCVVTQVRTKDRDGYAAIQIGFGDVKESRVNKPMAGHFKKAGVAPKRHLAEVRLDEAEAAQTKVGDTITVEAFEPGWRVHLTGTSKGKGFQGVKGQCVFKGV